MNVGIVLSGGMAKGAYQLGALRAISERIDIDDIKCISAASIGVLNGYSYIMNRLDEAENMYMDLCADESKLFLNQVLRGKTLQHDIKKMCSKEDVIDKEFFVSLLNISSRTIEYRNICHEKPSVVQEVLNACVAMPICNKAVKIEDKKYYDGALVDNIPIYPLLGKNLDLIICIYFDEECYLFENKVFDKKILKIVFPTQNTLKESLVFKAPELKRNIENGYKRTKMILNKVFPEDGSSKGLKYRIAQVNGKKSKKLRLTVDMIATNLNRVLQKILGREIEA